MPKDTTEDHGRRAYLIDPTTKLISQVYVKDYKDIQQHIGCEMFISQSKRQIEELVAGTNENFWDVAEAVYLALLHAKTDRDAASGLLGSANDSWDTIMDAVLQKGSEGDYGHGLSWYVPMSAGVELDTYKKAPYFDKKENMVVI